MCDYNISEFLDISKIRELLQNFYNLVKIPVSLSDLEGNVIIQIGNKKACYDFHKKNKKTLMKCVESRIDKIEKGNYFEFNCKNHMRNIAVPLHIGENQVANFFINSFFYEDDCIDYDFYENYAEENKYDSEEYKKAINEIPIIKKDKIKGIIDVFKSFVNVISDLCMSNLKLKEHIKKQEFYQKELKESEEQYKLLVQQQFIYERELKKSEEQYRLLAENIYDVIWKIDINTMRFTYVTPSIEKMTGFTVEESINSSVYRVLTPQSVELMKTILPQKIKDFYEGKKDIALNQFQQYCKNGNIKWIEVFTTFITNNNEIIEILGVTKDIDERKRYEEELKKSEENFNLLIDNLYDVIWKVDINTMKFIYVTPSIEKMVGFTVEEFVTKTVFEAVTPQSAEVIKNIIPQRVKDFYEGKKEIAVNQFQQYCKNGNIKWIEVFTTFITNNNNEIIEILGVTKDIDERKKYEEELKKSEEKYRLLAENIYDVIWKFDIKTMKFTYASPSVEKSKGFTPEECLKMTLKETLSKESFDIVRKILPKRIKDFYEGKKEAIVQTHQLQEYNKDGSLKWIEIITTFLTDKEGRITEVLGVTRDINERKKYENELKKSKEFLKSVINSSPFAIISVDLNGFVNNWNKSAEKIFGWKEEEVIGKFNPIIPNSNLLEFKNILEEVQNGDDFQSRELKRQRKDGKLIDIKVVTSSIKDENNNVVGIIGIIEDLTNFKKAQSINITLANIVENSLNEIYIFGDSNFNFKYLNERALKNTKYDTKDILGLTPFDIKPFLAKETLLNMLEQLKSGDEKQFVFETKHKRKDESFYDIKISLEYFKNEKFFVATGIDISDVKTAGEEIELNQKRIESLLKISQYKSENISELLEYSINEAVQLTSSKFGYIVLYNENINDFSSGVWSEKINIPLNFKIEENSFLSELIKNKNPFINNSFKENNTFKKSFPMGYIEIYKIIALPLIVNGKIVAIIIVGNKGKDYNQFDLNQLILMMSNVWKIVEQKKYEEQLKEEKEKAESANNAKSQFLANMSHEIRTPMNGIIGFTEVLLSEENDEQKKEYLSYISKCSENLLGIINSILDLSKIEANKIAIEEKKFNIYELFDKTISNFNNSVKEKGLNIVKNISKKIPQHVVGDETKLFQILTNLIDNAIKFTEKGEIIIGVDLKNDEFSSVLLNISVADTGIGIPNDKFDVIFENFIQIENYLTKKYKGSGLGLSIVKKLIQLLNGSITVESELNKGSVFSMLIPLKKCNTNELKTSFSEEYFFYNKKILIAEDNETNQILLQRYLERVNIFEVDIVDNGKDAVQLIKTNSYDLILMDIQMPIVDGIEASLLIREYEKQINRKTPIIAVTAYAMSGDKEKFLKYGIDDYISKPINKYDFFSLLKKYIS